MLAKEETEQKPAQAPEVSSFVSKASSAPQDIIARTIALAKAAKDKEDHPLAGGLFGALNLNVQTNLDNTQVPEKMLANLDANST
jgi:hypothetical protein